MAATAQTLDRELAMVIVEVCLNGSVLDFLMRTVMCCGLTIFGKKAKSSRVRACGTKSGENVAGKVRPRGAQGSIELNINSSLCFGKNSQKNSHVFNGIRTHDLPLSALTN